MERVLDPTDINIFDMIPRDMVNSEDFVEMAMGSSSKAFQALYEDIPYTGESPLDKKHVEKLEGMEWMKDCSFNLVHSKSKSLQRKTINDLIDKMKKECIITPEHISECGLPLLALDTETTSLILNFKIYGGTLKKEVSLVGVPVAVNEYKGYYLPVAHNETDGIKNFDEEQITYFLQRLCDEFFIIYFNYNYDVSILQLHGVYINPAHYADLMVISAVLGFDTIPEIGFSLGLKALSKFFLGRTMIEITEVVGSKTHIIFSRVPAKLAVSYAVSDATNTYGLFNQLCIQEKDHDYNPYLFNESILVLFHKALYQSISMFRHGLPLNDLEGLRENILTIINRILLLEKTYHKIENSEKYSISAPESVNYFLGEKILNELLIEGLGETVSMKVLDKKYKFYHKVKNFIDLISEDFAIICKVSTNKSRGDHIKFETRKDGWGASAKGLPVLDYVKKNINNSYWAKILSKKVRDDIYTIANVVDEYRGLALELGRIGKMYRYAIGDDRGYATADIYLKMFAADTKRYKNASGTGRDRLTFTGKNLTNVTYTGGNGLCGINAQGLPGTVYNFIKDTDKENPKKVKRIRSIGDKDLYFWYMAKRSRLTEILNKHLITKLNQKK